MECLYISQEVDAQTDVAETYIPANGVEFRIASFHGSAAFTQNAYVGIVWDYGGAGEEILWSIKGEGKMPDLEITRTGDGVKKLAIILSNGESGALVMSGVCYVRVG